ncbi:MAG: hypothetical protein ACI9W1_002522, partial [Candidatus Azotimanducaceae bacterium]
VHTSQHALTRGVTEFYVFSCHIKYPLILN